MQCVVKHRLNGKFLTEMARLQYNGARLNRREYCSASDCFTKARKGNGALAGSGY
jgi:hypothetical protein